MQFLYFLPNREQVTVEELVAMGLGYVFAAEPGTKVTTAFTPRAVQTGPGGETGLMVCRGNAELVGYYPKRQRFQKEPEANYWVGMFTDSIPTPAELQRDAMIDGTMLCLADGNDWLLPKSREWVDLEGELLVKMSLPRRLTRDEKGEWWPGEVKPRYARLWELAQEYAALAMGSDDDDEDATIRFQFDDYDELILQCFQCNYVVSAAEIDLLGIYDDQVRERVMRVLLDIDGYVELQKKTGRDSGDSGSGPPESMPDATIRDATNSTDQP